MPRNKEVWEERWLNVLPEPYRGNEIESWAHYSIVQRLPEIANRLIDENEYPLDMEENIHKLISEIPYASFSKFDECLNGDMITWNHLIERFTETNWLQIPWFYAEFYFYRRIVDITGYFLDGEFFHVDPFRYQKTMGTYQSFSEISIFLDKANQPARNTAERTKLLAKIIKFNLLGNRIDLSLWPIGNDAPPGEVIQSPQFNTMIVNDLDNFCSWFSQGQINRLDLLMDNAGFELLSDLILVDFLLRESLVEEVVLHVKPYPMFVSDVIVEDIYNLLSMMDKHQKSTKLLRALSKRIKFALEDRVIKIKVSQFMGLPLAMWEAPDYILKDFEQSDLIISKGDANYRRLLGDRMWSHQLPFGEVISYMPTATLALRMIKSDAGVGYPLDSYNFMKEKDPDWMKNGMWGCIQFWEG